MSSRNGSSSFRSCLTIPTSKRRAMPDHTIGSGPIEEEFRAKMNTLAGAVDEFFNGKLKRNKRKVGFILLVFPFGHKGRCNYISNAERADVVTLLKEHRCYFEGQPDTMEGRALCRNDIS